MTSWKWVVRVWNLLLYLELEGSIESMKDVIWRDRGLD